LAREETQPASGLGARLIGCVRNLGKALPQFGEEMVRPHILGGQDCQANENEQYPLQHGQKQSDYANPNENPADYQDQNSFGVPVHEKFRRSVIA